uniref:Plastid-encoded RNA polymerase subunit alpha n=2 Tax=Chlorella TaxID=3071 RepID=F2YGP3_CHLVA|nr:alpha subunit of RNA polymerase [Chlorella variabilis]ADZ05051.1 alpha subunit of RNA polymerase [Chlorella variabilis]AIH00137.1 RNA polymerase alpha subunit [Chlorella variabilis]AJP09467.1 RNA polymerase alpha subunit [Chlorella variabilis]AST08819.1 alpha subunit of RNA polymerase [Chlorella sp. ATCC 30562]
MTKTQKLFFSCVDSRIQDQGSMYARFHLGTFIQGQALTFANALRRTLLSEIPGIIMTDILVEGASHEFAILPGVEETVLDIILNLKKLVFAPSTSKLINLENFQATGFLKSCGPRKLSGADVKLPLTLKCVEPKAHIATITNGAEFALRFNLELRNPQQSVTNKIYYPVENKTRKLVLDNVPMPIQKVNYVIKALNGKQGLEYIVLEVWTDGSVLPQESVQFALKNLTNFFFQFAEMSK